MSAVVTLPPPCVLFEDDDLLVVNKPAGINSHAPALNSNDGLYDWLRKYQPRWSSLALIHRLDKETSGVLVLAKSPRARQSLTRQFTERSVRKSYLLLTDRRTPTIERRIRSALVRSGNRYYSRPLHAGADVAETIFRPAPAQCGLRCLSVQPLTGKTHQIRVHAAALGFPIAGDTLYGGSPAPRVCLHSHSLEFNHPATGKPISFECPTTFDADPRIALRTALLHRNETNAYRIIHGAADNQPGWYVDRLGDVLLSQSSAPLDSWQTGQLAAWLKNLGCHVGYHKILLRQPNLPAPTNAAPKLVLGRASSDPIRVLENNVHFQLDLQAGYSVGLFLDQRENRRALLTRCVAPGFNLDPPKPSAPWEVLNTFAYTGGFSVCAAMAGARTTSIDLSKRYMDWAKTNFQLNQLDPQEHTFLTGDVLDWLKRLARKSRRFHLILLDPPTFSRSKAHGVFRVEKDYPKLVAAALPLLHPNGVLFASANTLRLPAEAFVDAITHSITAAGRRIIRQHYATQSFDFPIGPAEPAHLKCLWLQID
jgi:23S rRNA (cytosine1962-C5)-methyltransferase